MQACLRTSSSLLRVDERPNGARSGQFERGYRIHGMLQAMVCPSFRNPFMNRLVDRYRRHLRDACVASALQLDDQVDQHIGFHRPLVVGRQHHLGRGEKALAIDGAQLGEGQEALVAVVVPVPLAPTRAGLRAARRC